MEPGKLTFFMFWKILKNGKSSKSFLKHFKFFRIFMFWKNRRGSVLSSFWNCFWCHFGTGFGVILGLVFDQFSCSFLLNFDVIFGGHFWILWCHPPNHPPTHSPTQPPTHPCAPTHPPTHPGFMSRSMTLNSQVPGFFRNGYPFRNGFWKPECIQKKMDIEMDVEWI